MIGLEIPCYPLNQSNARLRPNVSSSLVFSRASFSLYGVTLNLCWLVVTFLFILVDRWTTWVLFFTTLVNYRTLNILVLFFFSAEEGEEGEEDSPLSYDKLIMPGKVSLINVLRNIPNLGSVIEASQRKGILNP